MTALTTTPVVLESEPGSDVALPKLARQVAINVAERAGDLLRDGAARGTAVTAKGSADVVTQLDLDAEALIVGELRASFPGHRIVAEESGLVGAVRSRYTWLVDPLDGTNNLAIGLAAYGVGIALCEQGVPVLGVVHDPVHRTTWSAVRGRGVVTRGSMPEKRRRDERRGLVLAWTQGHGLARDDATTANGLKSALEGASQRVLQLWAPLLCWVMLARGDIDGLVGYHAEAIDLPAGSLIAREAGIDIRTFTGRRFDDRIDSTAAERTFVAARPDRIDQLLEVVSDV